MTDAQPAPTPAEPSRPGLDIERNRMLMVDYLENAWNRQDLEYAKRAVHPDVVFHDQIREGLPPGHASVPVLAKPYDPDELTSTLSRICR